MDRVTVRRAARGMGVVLVAGGLAGVVLAPSALAADPTVAFTSGTDWTVTDADAGIGPALSLPGPAQNVCLNASAPAPCPDGATGYGWPGSGWDASLAAIPGATWIWAPGITKDTSPADNDTYRFSKVVSVPGTPVGGSVSVAADDGATVYVNGTPVGGTSSPSQLSSYDIGSLLVAGDNAIVVVASNGPICGQPCSYQSNPGGVVFGGSISYQVATPTQAPTQAPGATSRPRVTNPPTSAIDAAPVPAPGSGAAWVVVVAGTAVAGALLASRRAVRRQR